ncbi:hypothetical protein BCR44DRAFT_1439359, partial [Catenaria anguillulae PL171]
PRHPSGTHLTYRAPPLPAPKLIPTSFLLRALSIPALAPPLPCAWCCVHSNDLILALTAADVPDDELAAAEGEILG